MVAKRKRSEPAVVPFFYAFRVSLIHDSVLCVVKTWLQNNSDSYVLAQEEARLVHVHGLMHSKRSLDAIRKSLSRVLADAIKLNAEGNRARMTGIRVVFILR